MEGGGGGREVGTIYRDITLSNRFYICCGYDDNKQEIQEITCANYINIRITLMFSIKTYLQKNVLTNNNLLSLLPYNPLLKRF